MSEVPISSIVSVTITRETQPVSQPGFGVILVLTTNAEAVAASWGGTERTREYTSSAGVLEDFASSAEAYKAANRIFSQNPHVDKIKIGREAARVAQQLTIVFSADVITGNTISTFTITQGDVTETITATAFDTNNATTLSNLATKIQATAAIATASSDASHTITLTAANDGVSFSVSAITLTGGVSQATVTRTTTVAGHGIADDLAEIVQVDNDWYGLIWIERTAIQVIACADAVEAMAKQFVTASSDTGIISSVSTTDIAYRLEALEYDRTAILYSADVAKYPDAGWLGKAFPYAPGKLNFKFKTIAGITADNLTATQKTAAETKKCNLYFTVAGTDMTSEGYSASGLFMDLLRDTDALTSDIQTRIFSLLSRQPKVPYTNAGIAQVLNQLNGALLKGVRDGILSDDPYNTDTDADDQSPFIITPPKLGDISFNDKANRLLPDIQFQAHYANAINRVDIDGLISV